MLWTIRAEIEVQYESETEPSIFEAEGAILDEIRETGLIGTDVMITETKVLPAGWNDYYPWGGDGLRTCAEIFAGKDQ